MCHLPETGGVLPLIIQEELGDAQHGLDGARGEADRTLIEEVLSEDQRDEKHREGESD